MHSTPRLYLPQSLSIGQLINLSKEHSHYLLHVMRLNIGDRLRLLGLNGEYAAQLKQRSELEVNSLLRIPEVEPAVTVGICLLKTKRLAQALDSATQLGATCIQPLISQHCQLHEINSQKIQRQLIEFTEQTERMSVPLLLTLTPIKNFLLDNPARQIIVALERSDHTLAEIAEAINFQLELNILIGPEGGFSLEERTMIHNLPNTLSVGLSNNILRAETALTVLLAQLQFIRDRTTNLASDKM